MGTNIVPQGSNANTLFDARMIGLILSEIMRLAEESNWNWRGIKEESVYAYAERIGYRVSRSSIRTLLTNCRFVGCGKEEGYFTFTNENFEVVKSFFRRFPVALTEREFSGTERFLIERVANSSGTPFQVRYVRIMRLTGLLIKELVAVVEAGSAAATTFEEKKTFQVLKRVLGAMRRIADQVTGNEKTG